MYITWNDSNYLMETILCEKNRKIMRCRRKRDIIKQEDIIINVENPPQHTHINLGNAEVRPCHRLHCPVYHHVGRRSLYITGTPVNKSCHSLSYV